jgi:hypothetical protein
MTTDLRGVRVDPDGTLTDIAIPDGGRLLDIAREQLGGDIDFGHYGRPGATITVIVNDTSIIDGLPANRLVTDFVGHVRGGPLYAYTLCGPALVFGLELTHGDIVDLPDELRTQLYALDGTTAGGAR